MKKFIAGLSDSVQRRPFQKWQVTVFLLCFSLNVSMGQRAVEFTSSDAAMQNAFKWAKEMALHYKGNSSDPVGPWYEAALPARSAFCVRDVSHQIIGAEIIGLSEENRNMLTRFAAHISENKDWCTYWEIDKDNKPAPVDYRNDKEFWYNLNANFDLMYSCWRLYLWTGDKRYVTNPEVQHFFEISATKFIDRWILQTDSLRTRPLHPNVPNPYNDQDSFHRCRGIPSYNEAIPDLIMGVDLIAAIYRGLLTYASVLRLQNKVARAKDFETKAESYRQEIENKWWDKKDSVYLIAYSAKNGYAKGGEIFLLWFDALKDRLRIRKNLEKLMTAESNIEVASYLPLLLYRHGNWDKACERLLYLANPATPRREYPEVSFAVLEAITTGLMGIEPDALNNRVTTLYREKKGHVAEAKNLPVLNSFIDVKHKSKETLFFNRGKSAIQWRAAFAGKHPVILLKGAKKKAEYYSDKSGGIFSYIDIIIKGGEKIVVGYEL